MVPNSALERDRAQRRGGSGLVATRVMRPDTLQKRGVLLNDFRIWLHERHGVFLSVLLTAKPPDPEEICRFLVMYGQEMYSSGKAYGKFAETINAIAAHRPAIRNQLTAAWDLCFAWLADEPTQHHPALPLSIFLAMMSLSLMWGWPVEAAVWGRTWCGILRVGEVLLAKSEDLILPSDAAPGVRFALLRINTPKARGRAARHQAARVDPPDMIALLEAVFGKMPRCQKLWQHSAATLRRRFSNLLAAIGLPVKRVGGRRPFDLGSLRPGGATFLLFECQDPQRVRRLGRWVSSKVMDIYIQEVMYTTYTEQLTPDTKMCIQLLASVFPHILEKAVGFLNAAIPPSTWLRLYQAEDTEEHGEAATAFSGSQDTTAEGKAVEKKNRLGRTELHNAVCRGDEECVQQLLQNRASVDAKDGSGWTPLHLAASEVSGPAKIIELLLEAGAMTEAKDLSGFTPLNLACSSKCDEAVAVLLRAAVDRDKLVKDMPNLADLQQSNDNVKASLKTFCDDLRRQRAERDELEAKLQAVESQLLDATKQEQDDMKNLLRNFALLSSANMKAEAAVQAVLNDLEALTSKDTEESSEDLQLRKDTLEAEVQTSHNELQKQKIARQLLEEQLRTLECQLLDSTVEKEEIRCLLEDLAAQTFACTKAQEQIQKALGDMEELAAANCAGKARYDLREPRAFAQFLQDSDIRLVRAKYLNYLAQSTQPLPRRQEAEFREFEFDGKAESALVSHEEVQNWAAGARAATICSVSHAWETREHPDPCRYQLELVADRAAWYEAAFETDVWIFYDYVSLFQYKRLLSMEERSFRAAMDNMHVMYSHECTMTFRIEHLTPTDVWESTMKNDQALIPVWDDKLQSIKSKPLKSLVKNRTAYLKRGWCIGEISWSSLRTHNSQNQCIDGSGSDKVEPDGQGLTGQVPLTPAQFIKAMETAEFTHRDEDLPIVIALQEKIFDEKVAVCEDLVLKGLPVQEIVALADALPLYRRLKTLKLDTFECNQEAADAFGEALATSQVVNLELVKPRPGSGPCMGKAVVDALRTNQSLTNIKAEDFDPAAKKAVAQALRKNISIKDRLPLDAPVRLKGVADALERNSLTNITMDPEYDQIGDEEAKAVAQILKTNTSVKSLDFGKTTIGDDGAKALAEALRCNQTLEELLLHEDQITDIGAEALAEALKVNKTLRSLTLYAFLEGVRAVEKMKREDRGNEFCFISLKEDEAAAATLQEMDEMDESSLPHIFNAACLGPRRLRDPHPRHAADFGSLLRPRGLREAPPGRRGQNRFQGLLGKDRLGLRERKRQRRNCASPVLTADVSPQRKSPWTYMRKIA
eukprot:s133_g14.t1